MPVEKSEQDDVPRCGMWPAALWLFILWGVGVFFFVWWILTR